MNLFKTLILSFAVTITVVGCSSENPKETPVSKDSTEASLVAEKQQNVVDTNAIAAFVKAFYKWAEKSEVVDFEGNPDAKESRYTGINWTAHAKRKEQLGNTGFFAKDFLDNYELIAKSIDAKLKSGKYEWLYGEVPPFGNDASPWCNCQDYPDNFLNKLKVKVVRNEGGNINLDVKLLANESYKMTIKDSVGNWKIIYLEGFDAKNY